jgi:replicative DNA helicase
VALAYDELICVAAAFDASLGPSIRSSLRREWLSDSMNARCFDVAHTLEAAGTPPTFVSAAAWFQAHQQTDAICYLLENVEPCMVLASDVQGALERLREIHATRELAALAGRMDAFQQRNPGATADELRIYLESQLAGISTASTAAGVNVMDAVDAACQQMIDLARAEAYGVGDRPGLWFGVHELDLHMGGLFPGQVCIIAARPGVGKSSLAGQFCIEQA